MARSAERVPLRVLARGEGWIVVAKPPSLVVHRGAHTLGEYAALQRVRDLVGRRVWPVHRLDRATSGCLLFATDRALAGPLHAALGAPTARKTYVALVRGWFSADGPVVVETPIKLGPDRYVPARSVVDCLGRSRDPRCSLLRVRPETGRNHQVRRHVRDLSHPVIRDHAHGDSRVNRWWRDNYGLTRLGLHALRLELDLPGGGRLDAVCPLFRDHAEVFARLPWWTEAVAREPALALPPLPLLDEPPGQGV